MAQWKIVLFGVFWRVLKWLGILLLARHFFHSNKASPTVVAAMSSFIIPRCCAYLFNAFIRVWEEILISNRNDLRPCAPELPQIEAEIWQRIAVVTVGAYFMTSLFPRDVIATILFWYLNFFDIWWVTKLLFLMWSQIIRFLRCKRKRE